MSFDYERRQIDRIYETSENVAKSLRRVADDIDRAVERAKANEGSEENFRSTYVDLPHEVTSLVVWGVANAQLDAPGRQLRELILVRESVRKRALPLAERLRAFSEAHKTRTPNAGDKIYEYITMAGPDDDRHEVSHIIDTALLDDLANFIDPKGA
jgi:hypothetical protein